MYRSQTEFPPDLTKPLHCQAHLEGRMENTPMNFLHCSWFIGFCCGALFVVLFEFKHICRGNLSDTGATIWFYCCQRSYFATVSFCHMMVKLLRRYVWRIHTNARGKRSFDELNIKWNRNLRTHDGTISHDILPKKTACSGFVIKALNPPVW